jgi:hypothetical protein
VLAEKMAIEQQVGALERAGNEEGLGEQVGVEETVSENWAERPKGSATTWRLARSEATAR